MKRTFKVFTRSRGNFVVEAYSRRHAVARIVARLAMSEAETVEVGAWCVTEIAPTKCGTKEELNPVSEEVSLVTITNKEQ